MKISATVYVVDINGDGSRFQSAGGASTFTDNPLRAQFQMGRLGAELDVEFWNHEGFPRARVREMRIDAELAD